MDISHFTRPVDATGLTSSLGASLHVRACGTNFHMQIMLHNKCYMYQCSSRDRKRKAHTAHRCVGAQLI